MKTGREDDVRLGEGGRRREKLSVSLFEAALLIKPCSPLQLLSVWKLEPGKKLDRFLRHQLQPAGY